MYRVGGRYTIGRWVDIPWVGGVDIPWVYRPPYPWYIDPSTHGILTPYPWNIEPSTYGISNPLLWYYELLSFGRNEGWFNLPWGGSKYNDKKLTPGSKYHMENWTRGENIIGKSTPGSIYNGVQNTIWHRHPLLPKTGWGKMKIWQIQVLSMLV